jgi:hypothetical protein
MSHCPRTQTLTGASVISPRYKLPSTSLQCPLFQMACDCDLTFTTPTLLTNNIFGTRAGGEAWPKAFGGPL